ncbi:MAG: 3-isopropylmalate dehydratase small subunit [Thermodesulfobacteriota bacterium]
MKAFGGPAIFLDRSDINTDEIIPARYLTEISKQALQPYLLEDLCLPGFVPGSPELAAARVLVTRANFGCGSSREHAVWVLEVNHINVVIAESFARIFRQNMFNCGLLAVELPAAAIDQLFALGGAVAIGVDPEAGQLTASQNGQTLTFPFQLAGFDRELVRHGGWLAYADQKY